MVGRLLDNLQSAGQLERTLVVVTSDHGESLGEHGERTHGVFVYDATMRVPWIVWAGSHLPKASTDALVRLIDVAPTTLDLVGVPAPSSFEGRSVLPEIARAWFGQAPVARTAYIEAMDANLTRNWAPLTGIVSGTTKFIELPIAELYDLTSDPKETANLFTRDTERARTLGALLRESASAFLARGSSAEKTTLGGEARQRLQALGYVASSAEPGNRMFTDADDPKTLIGPANDLQRAVVAFNAGSRAPSMDAVRAIARAHPGFTTAYGILASMQRENGDLRGAIATLEDVLRRGIADQSVMVVLAGYLQEADDAAKSVALLEAVVSAHPDYAEAYNSLGVAYMRAGRHDQARAALRRVLELDPTSATAYENLGADELSVGNLTAAVDDLKRAVDLDPLLYDALYNLALALHDLGRLDEARPYLERFVRDAPPGRYARDIAKLQTILVKSGTQKK